MRKRRLQRPAERRLNRALRIGQAVDGISSTTARSLVEGIAEPARGRIGAAQRRANALAQLVVGRAIDRFGPKWPALVTFSALVISIMGTGILPGQVWSVFAFGTAGTAAAWSLSTLLPSLVAQVTVPQERGRVLGWVHLWWNLAMMIGSLLGGYLFERRAGLPFIVAGTVNVLSVAVVIAFFRVAARARQN